MCVVWEKCLLRFSSWEAELQFSGQITILRRVKVERNEPNHQIVRNVLKLNVHFGIRPRQMRSKCSNLHSITQYMHALQSEMEIDIGKTCRYFLNYFPSQLISGDARKPNFRSPNPRTLYTKFLKNCYSTVKLEGFFKFFQFSKN